MLSSFFCSIPFPRVIPADKKDRVVRGKKNNAAPHPTCQYLGRSAKTAALAMSLSADIRFKETANLKQAFTNPIQIKGRKNRCGSSLAAIQGVKSWQITYGGRDDWLVAEHEMIERAVYEITSYSFQDTTPAPRLLRRCRSPVQ